MFKFQKAFSLVLLVLGLTAAVLMFAQGDTMTPTFLIGGVITSGILGGVSGKVGPVVGGKWKTIDYLRSYVIPANPNSSGQQVQRARMTQAVFIARQLLASLLQPYWNPFYSNMSGFNAWVSNNIGLLASSTYYLDENAIMAKGSVLSETILTAVYTTGDGLCEVTASDNTNGSTGLATDKALLVVANKNGTIYAVETNVGARSDADFATTIPTGLTASDIYVYLSYYRGTGSDVEVADSVGSVCSSS